MSKNFEKIRIGRLLGLGILTIAMLNCRLQANFPNQAVDYTGTPTLARPTSTATLTPFLTSPAEWTENAPLTTPGAIDRSIQVTSTHFVAEQLINGGELAQKAYDSTVHISFITGSSELPAGSGGMMYVEIEGKSYWVVITAGHVNEAFDTPNRFGITLTRSNFFTPSGGAAFETKEIGSAYKFDEFDNSVPDIGIFIISDEKSGQKLKQLFDRDKVIREEDIYENEISVDQRLSGIGTSVETRQRPHLLLDLRINPDEIYDAGQRLILDDTNAENGNSGLVLWLAKIPPAKAVGVVVEGYEHNIGLLDNVGLTTFASIGGKSGLLQLIYEAKNDLDSKN